jgi:TATA-box binding protein (TBP) (component of TFIID and TFIIIB)
MLSKTKNNKIAWVVEEGTMGNLNYENLSVTTMTMVFLLETNIDIPSTFHLLPVYKMDPLQLERPVRIKKTKTKVSKTLKNTKVIKNVKTVETPAKPERVSKKFKLPYCDKIGAILSMRHKNITRGIIRNNKFAVDIVTSVKNINLKITPTKVQLCGAKSRENGIEAVTLVINHLKNIKQQITYLQQHVQEFYDILQWLMVETKGEPTKKITTYQIQSNIILNVQDQFDDFTLITPSDIPDVFNQDAINYIISLTGDQNYYSDYISKVKNLLRFTMVYQPTICINTINEVMVNFNYNVGFKINRDKLNDTIDGKNGFLSHYDNALVNHVTVELPYKVDGKLVYRKNGKKLACYTWLIYASGNCVQSGPNQELMRKAFELFIRTMYELKPDILLT